MRTLSALLILLMTVNASAHQASITSDVVPASDSAQANLVKILSEKVQAEADQNVAPDQRTVLVERVDNRTTYTVQDHKSGAAARSGMQLQCTEFSPGPGGPAIQIQRYSCTFSAN